MIKYFLLYLSVRLFNTVVLIVDTVNKQTNITNGRLTSWSFTKRGGVEFGTTEDKSIWWHGTSGLQVQRPTPQATLPPRDLSYIHLHLSPSTGISRTHNGTRGVESSVDKQHRYRREHGFKSLFQALI